MFLDKYAPPPRIDRPATHTTVLVRMDTDKKPVVFQVMPMAKMWTRGSFLKPGDHVLVLRGGSVSTAHAVRNARADATSLVHAPIRADRRVSEPAGPSPWPPIRRERSAFARKSKKAKVCSVWPITQIGRVRRLKCVQSAYNPNRAVQLARKNTIVFQPKEFI